MYGLCQQVTIMPCNINIFLVISLFFLVISILFLVIQISCGSQQQHDRSAVLAQGQQWNLALQDIQLSVEAGYPKGKVKFHKTLDIVN